MKKIILAFDGTHFSEGAFEFARRLAEMQPVLLTGVFLPQVALANLWSYADASGGPLLMPMVEDNEAELVLKNIERFEELCRKNQIDYRVHRDYYNFAMPELKKESHYADVIILGSEVFYNRTGGSTPNDYLRDAMRNVDCPVVLAPETFKFPEKIILSYDGGENSVYAIKQFAYLFPELASLPTTLVYGSNKESAEFPDEALIRELVARHYSDLTFYLLDASPKKYFETWLMEQPASLLVSGSYGRSGLSQLFKKSFVQNVIADHQVPVFIAHK